VCTAAVEPDFKARRCDAALEATLLVTVGGSGSGALSQGATTNMTIKAAASMGTAMALSREAGHSCTTWTSDFAALVFQLVT
jgi:hypothetical protein